ncbi:MAG: hypothetical protein K0R00_661 [Herbinix sp.]|jgi:hypothetical protein|nr:hypothetical protein [Herbinix sp.]
MNSHLEPLVFLKGLVIGAVITVNVIYITG